MFRPVPETEVLKPRDTSLDGSTDEWPEFTLTNAHVHLPDEPEAITSLLEATAGCPLTVVGQLEPLAEEDSHLYSRAPSKKRVNIVVEDVRTFSYGQYGDGSTAIWAAGKAGWFTLKPGRGYKATYNQMAEAVNLLYFIADSYRNPRQQGKGRNTTTLPDYTAQELFDKYAKEQLDSSDSLMAAKKFHEHKDFLISSMLAKKEGLSWSRLPIYKHYHSHFPGLFIELRKRLQVPKSKGKPEDGLRGGGGGGSTEQAQWTEKKHVRKGSFGSNSTTTNSGRRAGRPRMNKSHIGDHNSVNEGMNRNSMSRQTRQQSVTGAMREASKDDAIMDLTRDDETDEETRLRARKNKSSLRPRPSNASKSTGRKSGKGPAVDDIEDAEMPSSPVASKRKYEEDLNSRPLSKRQNSGPHDDEGIDMPTSPSASSDGDENSTSTAVGGSSKLALRLNHVPDRIQEDTWVCALDGCTHKVYAASNADSQRLIREHYRLHTYDDDERVQLVKKLQEPSLPASHLMERVKMQARIEGYPGSASRQIASRYPVTLPSLKLGVAQRY